LTRCKDVRSKPLPPARKPASGGHLRGRGNAGGKLGPGRGRGSQAGRK
jgi:hypothetical protein